MIMSLKVWEAFFWEGMGVTFSPTTGGGRCCVSGTPGVGFLGLGSRPKLFDEVPGLRFTITTVVNGSRKATNGPFGAGPVQENTNVEPHDHRIAQWPGMAAHLATSVKRT